MKDFGVKLDRRFYLQDTVTVARSLLGKYIVRMEKGLPLVAEITETEAYTGVEDKACHSFGGKMTDRTRVMYRSGGYAYIYMIYGMHFMLNVVTEKAGNPCAVLIRGARPVSGLDRISELRYDKKYDALSSARKRAILDGPGKICNGLGLTKKDNGADLLGDKLFLTEPVEELPFQVGVGTRINIDYAGEAADYPYRFFIVRQGGNGN